MAKNKDYLEGMRCPNCDSRQPFEIDMTFHVPVYDKTGPSFREEDHHFYWDADSYCRCPACDHDGEVRDFQIPDDADRPGSRAGEEEEDRR